MAGLPLMLSGFTFLQREANIYTHELLFTVEFLPIATYGFEKFIPNGMDLSLYRVDLLLTSLA